MPSRKRRYFVILRNSLLLLLLVLLIFYVGLFLVKNKFTEKLIAKIQEKTGLVVNIERSSWSFFDDFPHISLTLHEFIAQKPEAKDTIFYAQKVAFNASITQLLNSPFTIQSITITSGFMVIKVDSGNMYPFQLPKQTPIQLAENAKKPRIAIDFAIHRIVLKNLNFHYSNANNKQIHEGTFQQFYLYPIFQENKIAARVEGKAYLQQIAFNKLKPTEFLTKQNVRLKGHFHWQKTEKNFVLDTLTLFQKNATFGMKGHYNVAQKQVHLLIQTPNIELQHAAEIVPKRTSKYLQKYSTNGGLAVQTYITGSSTRPLVEVFFQAKKIQFIFPNPHWHVDSLYLNGKLTVGTGNPATDGFVIPNLKGNFNGNPVIASVEMHHFKERHTTIQLKTTLNLADFQQSIKPVKELSGKMKVDIQIKGKYDDLRNANNPPSLVGNAQLRNASVRMKDSRYLFQNVNGNITFKDKKIIIHHLSTVVRKSDFAIKGVLHDFVPYLLDEEKPLIGKLSLYARFVELNELLKRKNHSKDSTSSAYYELEVDENVNLAIQAQINQLKFRQLNATQIRSNLIVRNKQLKTNITANMCEGNIAFSAQLKPTSNKKWMELNTVSQLNHINISSFFAAMENFNQTVLQDENIDGNLTSTIQFKANINDSLLIDMNSIHADIQFTLTNGALIDFEPAMNMKNILLRNRNFKHIRFSTIKNQFKIRGKYINIPRMAIASNIIDVYVQGNIKMGDSIDLLLQVPLSNLRRRDKNYVPQELANDATIGKHIPIRIKNTFDEMSIKAKRKKRKQHNP